MVNKNETFKICFYWYFGLFSDTIFKVKKMCIWFIYNGVRTIVPEENCHRLGLGFGLGLELGLGAIFLGGNCPRTIYNVS